MQALLPIVLYFYIIPTYVISFIALVFLYIFYTELASVEEILQWQKREMIVTEVREVEYQDTKRTRHYPKVFGKYVDTGETVRLYGDIVPEFQVDTERGKQHVDSARRNFPVGKKLTVYVDEQSPDRPRIISRPDSRYQEKLNQIHICIYTLLHFVFFFFVVRKWHKRQEEKYFPKEKSTPAE